MTVDITDMNGNSERSDLIRQTLEGIIGQGSDLVILAFRADWSGNCQIMEPILDSVSVSYQGRIKIVSIDVDQDRMLVGLLHIAIVPSFFFVKNGNIVDHITSLARKEDFEEIIAKHITK